MREHGVDLRRACQTPGCARLTTGGKPHCLTHLDELPYVGEVRARLREFEEDAAEGARPVNLEGPVVKEILGLLQDGPRTLEDLAARLSITRGVAARHVEALVEAKLVQRRRTGWRTEALSLRS